MSKNLIIMMGLPRSGKSTIAKQFNGYKVIELDEVRRSILNTDYQEDAEPFIWDYARDLIIKEFETSNNVVIDECNPNFLLLSFWLKIGSLVEDLKITVVKVDTPMEVCFRRTDSEVLKKAIERKNSVMDTNEFLNEFCKKLNIEFKLVEG